MIQFTIIAKRVQPTEAHTSSGETRGKEGSLEILLITGFTKDESKKSTAKGTLTNNTQG